MSDAAWRRVPVGRSRSLPFTVTHLEAKVLQHAGSNAQRCAELEVVQELAVDLHSVQLQTERLGAGARTQADQVILYRRRLKKLAEHGLQPLNGPAFYCRRHGSRWALRQRAQGLRVLEGCLVTGRPPGVRCDAGTCAKYIASAMRPSDTPGTLVAARQKED